jgi:hypothetical protein
MQRADLGEKTGTHGGSGVPRVRRKWRPSVLTAVIVFAAQWSCGLVASSADSNGAAGAGNTGTGGTGGRSPALGGTGGLIVGTGGNDCPSMDTLFADQGVPVPTGAPRVFYSWTTDEQVAELRAGGALFSRTERPGLGRGQAFTELAAFAATGSAPEQVLAGRLESVVFATARFAWTNPWATLLGWPGETYGNQLLQIELKPEAWIAFFNGQTLQVLDAQGQYIPIDTALASPERIGAIYYMATPDPTSSYCGSFSTGAPAAFREFILGNIGMVQRWSLATPEIAARLESDIAELQAFQAALECMTPIDQSYWADTARCEWVGGYGNMTHNYDMALAIPNELYVPTPDNIAALVAALQASMPTGTPLDVTPPNG